MAESAVVENIRQFFSVSLREKRERARTHTSAERISTHADDDDARDRRNEGGAAALGAHPHCSGTPPSAEAAAITRWRCAGEGNERGGVVTRE
jgi:hypothetical protein